MATTIPCTVDTHPMAQQINNVSVHVDQTTQAVVSMESAVILAEKEGAENVCRNVNRGFFTMIQSQISQKIAGSCSKVDALLMQLKQQRRRLLGIQSNMEKEYTRICERYFKIFTSINKELERRIKELDRPVFNLVTKEMSTATNRMHSLAGWTYLLQDEDLTQGQSILMSNLKWDARKALDKSRLFLTHMAYQKKLTHSVTISNTYDREGRDYDVPVAVSETVSDSSGLGVKKITVCQGLSRSESRRVEDAVSRHQDFDWKDGEINKNVEQEFYKLVDSSHIAARVREMIKQIYNRNNPQTL